MTKMNGCRFFVASLIILGLGLRGGTASSDCVGKQYDDRSFPNQSRWNEMGYVYRVKNHMRAHTLSNNLQRKGSNNRLQARDS